MNFLGIASLRQTPLRNEIKSVIEMKIEKQFREIYYSFFCLRESSTKDLGFYSRKSFLFVSFIHCLCYPELRKSK